MFRLAPDPPDFNPSCANQTNSQGIHTNIYMMMIYIYRFRQRLEVKLNKEDMKDEDVGGAVKSDDLTFELLSQTCLY